MPSLAELFGGAALIAALFGGIEYVRVLQLKNTITNMQLAAKQAQVDEDAKSAKLSAQILTTEQSKLSAIRAAVAAALQKVASDAPTNTCGPAVRDAVRSLQHGGGNAGAPASGR
jgi:hypothetical protein